MSYVLFLGAKSDIAQKLAILFAKKNYNLYLASRNSIELSVFSEYIRTTYKVAVKVLEFDLCKYDTHFEFYDRLKEKPEVVVCAAGYLGNAEAIDDFIETKKIIDTNYVGYVSILDIIVRDFKEKNKGVIIGISSVAGDRGRKSNYVYGSAKAGFSTYLAGLRNTFYEKNVRIITVKPGYVNTKMTKNLEIPKFFLASSEHVANDILKAYEKKKDTIYTPWYWSIIMKIIAIIPEKLFKRMHI